MKNIVGTFLKNVPISVLFKQAVPVHFTVERDKEVEQHRALNLLSLFKM